MPSAPPPVARLIAIATYDGSLNLNPIRRVASETLEPGIYSACVGSLASGTVTPAGGDQQTLVS